MGIYFDHGVAFVAEKKEESAMTVTLVSAKDLDNRLASSGYFTKRRDGWFALGSLMNAFGENTLKIIPSNESPDIDLTPEEQSCVRGFCDAHPVGWTVGWYETLSVSSSLE
jgi:hypothetical protein